MSTTWNLVSLSHACVSSLSFFIALPHSKLNLPQDTYSFFLSIHFINGLLWMILEMAKRLRICTAFVLDPSSFSITHIKYAQQPVLTTSWGSNTSGFHRNLHWCVPTHTQIYRILNNKTIIFYIFVNTHPQELELSVLVRLFFLRWWRKLYSRIA